MARKSRVITEIQKQESTKAFEWKIGIYIRLSKEDLRNNDESESVTNQRKIQYWNLWKKNYCNETYIIYDIYVDDGRSGTTEDTRPDFQRLSKDIREGNVNCVVCKTLARAFRNYADQGEVSGAVSPYIRLPLLSHLAIPTLTHSQTLTVRKTWKSQ